MLFDENNTESKKTKEQKLASKQRYLAQEDKATQMLINASSIYDYIDGLKYTLSLCQRYSKNFKDFVLECGQIDRWDKCLKAGILKDWNNTYWFDKDKAERLQQYILEHQS